MAAIDTIEWFVSTMIKHPDERVLRQIKAQRVYLLTLRSENERQRYVDEASKEIRSLREKSL